MIRNILVAGTYGVGKSYISKIIEKETLLKVYTASSLIKHHRYEKDVESVFHNQKLLIEAVSDINRSQPSIIIDGHFCILNKQNKMVPIEPDVFKDLNLCKLVLLFDEPERIEKRLLSRDGKSFEQSLILSMQDSELRHGESVSKSLTIPLMKFHAATGDFQLLLDFIKSDN